MDKSWVHLNRLSGDYEMGLQQFLNSAFSNCAFNNKIKCPCTECCNRFWRPRHIVENHLRIEGMEPRYINVPWVAHGEALPVSGLSCQHDKEQPNECDEDLHDLVYDAFGHQTPSDIDPQPSELPVISGRTLGAEKFYKLLAESNVELYPGCRTIKRLDFLIQLFHTKCLYGWSNKSFSVALNLFKRSLPEGETLPKSFYHTKRLIAGLGLSYDKIDACPNNCLLYWKANAKDEVCKTCGVSRYLNGENTKKSKKKIPAKQLRYFPLTSRLQRLYMSRHTAENMVWHSTKRTQDGILRHPADSLAWKKLDELYPNFANESRNVRIGLASDGFNPFGHMSNAHSTWPIVLAIYNLPPWLCMKEPYMILSSVIPGPHAPSNAIDVYLEPLIDELKDLWEIGKLTYDVFANQSFTLRAALLWTINDFPAYATLSGWSTKGKLACPQCNDLTCSLWLKHGFKFCYMGHRRFLPILHRFRCQTIEFNGHEEHSLSPLPMTGPQCLRSLSGLRFVFGKTPPLPSGSKRSRAQANTSSLDPKGPWKKRSIFFNLPYWKDLLIRHNLDVMHIEKNVCESVFGTLLDIDGKTKDGLSARADLKALNMMDDLQIIDQGNKNYLPPALFTLDKKEKETFCKILKSVRVPDGYSSNVSRCVQVKEKKLVGLKSHDCHVLMHHLLPLAIRCAVPKQLTKVLLELCSFFRALCCKNQSALAFNSLSRRIALILCHLERLFPPAFFDVMVHLPIHLGHEAAIAGPVHYRWMYPIERFLGTLKSYVRNKSKPEGSICEGYLANECLSFCSMYLDDIESRKNRTNRNADGVGRDVIGGLSIFSAAGRPLGGKEVIILPHSEWETARNWVLCNCLEVEPHLSIHLEHARRHRGRRRLREAERTAVETFPEWFKQHANEMRMTDDSIVHGDLCALAEGPSMTVKRYKRYVINGFRFRIKQIDATKKNQNCGVFVTAQTSSYASA